jgi:hypothetical protein
MNTDNTDSPPCANPSHVTSTDPGLALRARKLASLQALLAHAGMEERLVMVLFASRRRREGTRTATLVSGSVSTVTEGTAVIRLEADADQSTMLVPLDDVQSVRVVDDFNDVRWDAADVAGDAFAPLYNEQVRS